MVPKHPLLATLLPLLAACAAVVPEPQPPPQPAPERVQRSARATPPRPPAPARTEARSPRAPNAAAQSMLPEDAGHAGGGATAGSQGGLTEPAGTTGEAGRSERGGAATAAGEGAAAAQPLPGGTDPASGPPDRPAAPGPAGQIYRVRADGTVGCADPNALRLLRQLKATPGASPRLLAQAHRDGRCMTVFTTSTWALDRAEGGVIRLRPAGRQAAGMPAALYFLREEVVPVEGE